MSWGIGFWFKLVLGIWALVFVAIIAPFAAVHHWKVGTLPIVEGTLSNHHVVERKRHKSPGFARIVHATLEFDRPDNDGHIHCKLDNVAIGDEWKRESFAVRVELAVRTDSCHGYFFLPLASPGFAEWIGVFLLIGGILFCFVVILYYSDRIESLTTAGKRRAAGNPAEGQPPAAF